MNIKFIFKALSFTLLTSFVFASETDDCNEIQKYLESKSLDYTKTIGKCITNDQGKVIELQVNNEDLQEEDVNKILSYDSIKDLEYNVVFTESDERDTPYSYVLNPHPGFTSFPSAIANLPELETLCFNYKNIRKVKYRYDLYQIPVEDGSLKLSKKLKKLTLGQVELSSENLKEISSITSLEEISINYSIFNENDISSFENLENLTKLVVTNPLGVEKVIPNNINKIKSLKELRILNGYCEKPSYDFSGLNDLEILYFGITEVCSIDISKLDKLSELYIIGPDDIHFGVGIKSSLSLELPKNIKKMGLESLTFSADEYKSIASLPDLEELSLVYYSDSAKFDITSLECHNKLKRLTISPAHYHNNILENLDFLNNLENLTYLDLHETEITEIPQLQNLKKLEHLDLSRNKLFKFPSGLSSLKNLEYLNLYENEIYDEIPESLNNLDRLKYFNVSDNQFIKGKVLIIDSLQECSYNSYIAKYELCVPKGYEVKCLKDSYDTCEEGGNIGESNDGKCGEGNGKCPDGQCCNKDGQCGTSEDYCLASKGCQTDYGHCVDECEQIIEQLRNMGLTGINSPISKCILNEKGKVKDLKLFYGQQKYIDQLSNLSDLETLDIECTEIVDNFKAIRQNQKLTEINLKLYYDDNNLEFPEDITYLENLKTLEIHSLDLKSLPSSIKNLKNLENLLMNRCSLTNLPIEIGELENLKKLDLSENKFTKFPEVISSLKNLEHLDFYDNYLSDKFPESYINLTKLTYVNFDDNTQIQGKILQNESLVTCEYNYPLLENEVVYLCRTGNEKCLSEKGIKSFPLCKGYTAETTTTTTTTTTTKTTTTKTKTTKKPKTTTTTTTTTKKTKTTKKPKTTTTTTTTKKTKTTKKPKTTTTTTTTKKHRTTTTTKKHRTTTTTKKRRTTTTTKKHRTTTTTKKHRTTTTTKKSKTTKKTTTKKTKTTSKPSVEGRCGKGYGNCPSGQCCSRYGWCGKSSFHCSSSYGCQKKYGKCK